MTENKDKNGFTVETEVWCSAGFYKTFDKLKEIKNEKDHFMTDSFDKEQIAFVTNLANIEDMGGTQELVEITYGSPVKLGSKWYDITVRCTPNQEFLTCYENNGTLHYKGNETFIWRKASELKDGMRLVAEDANLVVKKVVKVVEKAQVYSVKTDEENNFSIRLGVIVKGA